MHLPELTAQQLSSTVYTPSNSSIVSSPTSIPASLSLINCSLGKPPADPIDMNTVIFKDIAETVHVEKEIFTCKARIGASVIALVSIYTELFENMRTLKPLTKMVEAVTCVKGYNGTVSYCNSKSIPLANQLVYLNCDPKVLRVLPLSLPIEMETVVSLKESQKLLNQKKRFFFVT